MAEDDPRCPECGSTNLKGESIRDVQRPRRKSERADVERPVLARKVDCDSFQFGHVWANRTYS